MKATKKSKNFKTFTIPVVVVLIGAFGWAGQANAYLHPDREANMKPAVDVPWWEKAAQIDALYQADPTLPMFQKSADLAGPRSTVFSSGEFEPLDEVILSWDYYGGDDIDYMYRQMVDATLDAGATPRIVAKTTNKKNQIVSYLAAGGIPTGQIEFNIYRFDSMWLRDYGPFPLLDYLGQTAWSDSNYYPTRPRDDNLPIWLAAELGYPCYHFDVDYEGGNFTNNGDGLCLASDTVLYYNPSYTEAEMEDVFDTYLGCEDLVILEPMQGDGTGHVDMFTIFIDRDTIVVGEFEYSQDPTNKAILDANAALLDGYPLPGGGYLNVVRIPMPDPSYFYKRTFTNGLHINDIYLLPVYSVSTDKAAQAQAILQAQLPGWEIRMINADAIIPYYGAMHCITQVNRIGTGDCWDDDYDGYDDEDCGGTDCDDSDYWINPGADEICTDSVDNDCDGLIDGADPECPAAFTLDLDASYYAGTLNLDYTLGTPEPATWENILILTYPTMQVIPLWSVSLPVINPPIDIPVAFPFPSLGLVGIFSGLFTAGGPQAVEMPWVDTGY